MDTTEIFNNAFDWVDKRLEIDGEKLTQNQRNLIMFALRMQCSNYVSIEQKIEQDKIQFKKFEL